MEVRTYSVTPQRLEEVAAKMKANGIAFDPHQPTGEAQAHGFHVQWKIDGDRVSLTMLQHPPFMAGVFWSQVEQNLGAAVA
jgi:hypothetical protein